MANKRPIPQYRFKVEEKHRGKWQPLIAEDEKPKEVVTTEEFARMQNIDAETTHIRYVKVKEEKKNEVKSDDSSDDLEALKEEYKEKAGKPAHHTWNAERIKEKLAEL